MLKILSIGIGGFIGAILRYGMAEYISLNSGSFYPWGTFSVNLLGAFTIGFLWKALEYVPINADLKALIFVGMIGAFTTFSTFMFETVKLLQDSEYLYALTYLFGSIVFGLVAVYLGIFSVKFIKLIY